MGVFSTSLAKESTVNLLKNLKDEIAKLKTFMDTVVFSTSPEDLYASRNISSSNAIMYSSSNYAKMKKRYDAISGIQNEIQSRIDSPPEKVARQITPEDLQNYREQLATSLNYTTSRSESLTIAVEEVINDFLPKTIALEKLDSTMKEIRVKREEHAITYNANNKFFNKSKTPAAHVLPVTNIAFTLLNDVRKAYITLDKTLSLDEQRNTLQPHITKFNEHFERESDFLKQQRGISLNEDQASKNPITLTANAAKDAARIANRNIKKLDVVTGLTAPDSYSKNIEKERTRHYPQTYELLNKAKGDLEKLMKTMEPVASLTVQDAKERLRSHSETDSDHSDDNQYGL